MITLTGTILFLIAADGLMLKLACWLYNYWFTRSHWIPGKNSATSPTISTTQKGEEKEGGDPVPGAEQANPFSPPHQMAKPIAASKEPRVVGPTFIRAIGYGVLLFGLQVVLSVSGYWLIHFWGGPRGSSLPYLIIVLAYYAATAGLISVLLPSRFTRSLVVTGIFYGLILVATSPITILLLLLAMSYGSGWT